MRLTERVRRARRARRPSFHVVGWGQSYASIAMHYGMDWDRLYAYNTDPAIVGGQVAAERRKRGPALAQRGEQLVLPPESYRAGAWTDERYLLHRGAWERTGDPEELELMLASLVLADDTAWPTAWPLR